MHTPRDAAAAHMNRGPRAQNWRSVAEARTELLALERGTKARGGATKAELERMSAVRASMETPHQRFRKFHRHHHNGGGARRQYRIVTRAPATAAAPVAAAAEGSRSAAWGIVLEDDE